MTRFTLSHDHEVARALRHHRHHDKAAGHAGGFRPSGPGAAATSPSHQLGLDAQSRFLDKPASVRVRSSCKLMSVQVGQAFNGNDSR